MTPQRLKLGFLASGNGTSAREEYDRGPIVAQRSVPVEPGDTAETLEARITAVEPLFFVETLRRISKGELAL